MFMAKRHALTIDSYPVIHCVDTFLTGFCFRTGFTTCACCKINCDRSRGSSFLWRLRCPNDTTWAPCTSASFVFRNAKITSDSVLEMASFLESFLHQKRVSDASDACYQCIHLYIRLQMQPTLST
jgi:hypothetical protein